MASGTATRPANYCSKCGKPLEPGAKFCANCGTASAQQDLPEQNVVKVADGKAEVHLKRAWGLMTEVEKATETFRQRAIQHDAQLDQDQPFMSMLVTGFKGATHLKREKSTLISDLQLASQELDKAAALNPDATLQIDVDKGLSINVMRSSIHHLNGQIEMIWGKSDRAKELFSQSLQIMEMPDSHYMLGLLCESEYKPAEALKHFERCLELDPDGELSVPALREANAMRKYKKKFRGNWVLFIILLMFPIPVVFGVIYFLAKRK